MSPRGGQNRLVYDERQVDQVRRLYDSGLTQSEVGQIVGLSQRDVWKLMRRCGIDSRPAAKRDQRQEKNSSWKGGRTITSGGYIAILMPSHPRAGSNGYVFEHILCAERKLGRPLIWHGSGHPESEIVHHIDGNKQNNHESSLEIHSYTSHLAQHLRCGSTGRMIG